MRILLLTQYFPPEAGAAPTRLGAMVKSLVKLGHEVEVVTALPNYPFGEILPPYQGRFYVKDEYQGCQVHRFWLVAGQGRTLLRILNYLTFAFTACFGIFKAKRPDLIFVNSGPLFVTLPAQLMSMWWRVPYVFNVSDLWPRSVEHLQGLGGRVFIWVALKLEFMSYKRALYVNAITEGVKEILLKEKNLPPSKVLFLPNGVDTEVFSPRPPDEELLKRLRLQGKKVVIYPGNHGYAHALEFVLQAAALVSPDVCFLFVGGGSEKAKLQKMAEEMGLKNVIFHEPVAPERLADYIELADLGLIHVRNSPLAEETRPAKMFPMMAMAKPILYAGFGEGAGLLKKVGGGMIVAPENPKSLAEALQSMLMQPAQLRLWGQNNRHFVAESMEFSKLVSDWLRTLKIK